MTKNLAATRGPWAVQVPAEPPASVLAVRDRDGDFWIRDGAGWLLRGSYAAVVQWLELINFYGPLTDATDEFELRHRAPDDEPPVEDTDSETEAALAGAR